MADYITLVRVSIGSRTLDTIHAATMGVARLWRLWRQRTHARQLAGQFSDRDLWDVGLTRGDIYREFARPFWRGGDVWQ